MCLVKKLFFKLRFYIYIDGFEFKYYKFNYCYYIMK